ncbi:TetR/AcrR family transcriptional regulator [Paenibacillus sp. R14(2021)]|uniref:TetR/AcrR family transcriptional regulator n=1 Tax=Paenibacillus sp. R14(2021) TaxID=2859228 RepID=UPI001C61287E|nr:TetR/AcrR family transcriptional regulator [Paenibacillus sp. R14(2021)]
MAAEAKIDRRIVKTKEAINKAFLELFVSKAFEQITINDISERANVNRGTVYLHYTDKYDLLNKCIEEHFSRMFLSCKHTDTQSEPTEMIGQIKPVFDYFEAHFLFFSSMLSKTRSSVFRERMLEFVTANIIEKLDKQDIGPGMDKHVMTQFMASALVGTIEWWIVNHMPHSPQSMAEQLKQLFERKAVYPL